jgi:hypothetical protein
MNPFVNHAILLAQVGSTLFMVGLIWFVQIVHYPLMGQVGSAEFVAYETSHANRTSLVVMPVMLIEAITTVLLVLRPPPDLEVSQLWIGLALLALIWISTFLLQIPRHEELTRGFDAQAHRFLVGSNWIRTIAWTLRGVLVLGWVGSKLS